MNNIIYSLTLSALATGRMVRVGFEVQTPGVDVPDMFADKKRLALDFGRRAPTPIDDLVCDEKGIGGTLRFGDEYHWCFVPWGAVISMNKIGPTPAQRAWTPFVVNGGKK